MQLLTLSRETRLPKADYAFDELKDFMKVLPYLYPKLVGEWVVLLVELKLPQVEELSALEDLPEYLDLKVYLKPDVLATFVSRHPEYEKSKQSKWEQFLSILGTYDRFIEEKAARAVYQRCYGASEVIEEKLADLKTFTDGPITLALVNKVLPAENVVYARDVFLAIWAHELYTIPRRGHVFSHYKNKSLDKLIDQFVSSLGRDYAFYALRKYIRKIYKEKQKYISGAEAKDILVCETIDIDTVTFAFAAFEVSNPKQLHVVLETLKGRKDNDSLLSTALLKHYSKHYLSD